MKRTIATLIAGLFATAAFAQTPAPTTPAPTQTPASAVSPAVAKAEAQHDKATAQADTSKAKPAKHVKHVKHAKHAKANNKHETTMDAAKDGTTAAASDTTSAK